MAAVLLFGPDRLTHVSDIITAMAREQPAGTIRVIDGDTISVGKSKPNARLVGFNAPETSDAECARERELGQRAKARLRELIGEGGIGLTYVQCSCRLGTRGTDACNYGRDCARLWSHGRDVGSILIAEGLAEPYVCGVTSCPRRRSWC